MHSLLEAGAQRFQAVALSSLGCKNMKFFMDVKRPGLLLGQQPDRFLEIVQRERGRERNDIGSKSSELDEK
jgi:hypothetical protein